MTTWSGRFRPLPGQTMGSGGVTREGPSAAIDQLLGLVNGRERPLQEQFLYDFNNPETDRFLREMSGYSRNINPRDVQYMSGADQAKYNTARSLGFPGADILAQRAQLRQNRARAFMGPDGTFQFIPTQGGDTSQWGPLAEGSTRLTGEGSYDPVSQALGGRGASVFGRNNMGGTERAVNLRTPRRTA